MALERNQVAIQAQQIDYDESLSKITATENVIIDFRQNRIRTDLFEYHIDSQVINIPNQYTLNSGLQHITGNHFVFNVRDNTGETHDPELHADRLKIIGRVMRITAEKVILKDVSFTTCKPGKDAHYRIESEEMHLYPQFGFFVAFNNRMYSAFLPIPIWLPTYFQGSNRYRVDDDSSPIPEFGSNRREGVYVKQRFGYFFNNRSTGTLELGYMQNLGLFAGFQHGFMVRDADVFTVKFHHIGRDGLAGGGEYLWNFPEPDTHKASAGDDSLAGLFQAFSERQQLPLSQVRLRYVFRELVHESRVDYTPEISFALNELKIRELASDFSLEGSLGHLLEDTPDRQLIDANQGELKTRLSRYFSLGKNWQLQTALIHNYNRYSTEDSWQRLFARARLAWQNTFLNPRFTYLKRVGPIVGSSPFVFQQDFSSISDEFGLELTQDFGQVQLGLEWFQNIEAGELRQLDIITRYTFHCWRLIGRWRAREGNVALGVELF